MSKKKCIFAATKSCHDRTSPRPRTMAAQTITEKHRVNPKNDIFRLRMSLRHKLTSRYTLGYGIHSPHLYYIARAILPENYPYYCFSAIERQRADFLRSTERVYQLDYGTGHSGEKAVAEIAAVSLKPRREAQLLMRLAVMMQAREILELGTSLGLTTAYLASASSRSRVTTFEGAPDVAQIAQRGWKALGLENITLVTGNIDDTLPAHLPSGTIDLAYMDANHTGEATLRYLELLLPHAGQKSIFVVDDIRYSSDMYAAWQQICAHPEVTATMDLGSMGLVFFDTNFEKKTYKIRL